MDPRERAGFERAVEAAKDEARERSHEQAPGAPGASGPGPGEEAEQIARSRPQGVVDPRTKNSGHGQKTADKWNQ